jgi:hypothetical protein
MSDTLAPYPGEWASQVWLMSCSAPSKISRDMEQVCNPDVRQGRAPPHYRFRLRR